MATITATKEGNWSDTSVWDLGRVPQDGDDVALASYAIVFDTAQTRIPATGSLASISATTTGQITLDLSNAAFHGGVSLNVTGNITAGSSVPTSRGVVYVFGSTDHVLTIAAGGIVGGSGANCYGLNHNSTGTINVTASFTAGNTSGTYGFYTGNGGTTTITGDITANAVAGAYFYTGTITINGSITATATPGAINAYSTVTVNGGNITGGTAYDAYGYWHYSTGTTTLGANTNLVQGAYGAAYSGKAPKWSSASAAANGYAKFYVGTANFGQAANTEFPQVLVATNIKAGVVSGSVTGTLTGGGSLVGKSALVG